MHLTPNHKTRINLAELREAEILLPADVVRVAPLVHLHARRWSINFDSPRLAEETAFIVQREVARRRQPAMQIAS